MKYTKPKETPETDAFIVKMERIGVRISPEAIDHAKQLEQRCNALAARVAELEPDAERYATMRRAILNDFNGLKFLQYMRWPLDTFDAAGGFDAAIDAARSEP